MSYGSQIIQHFQKCFTDYDQRTWVQQNVQHDCGLLLNLVFSVGKINMLHGKSEQLLHYASNFLESLAMCSDNNGYTREYLNR